jgi:DNA transformation protein and related proteins
MTVDASHIAYLLDLLSAAGAATARRMFGGHGLYIDAMVAVVVDGELYLKTDDETRPIFATAGCSAWRYAGKGKPVEMSYWSVPAEAMDSSEAMAPWARLALAAARRKAAAKPVRGRSRGAESISKKDKK